MQAMNLSRWKTGTMPVSEQTISLAKGLKMQHERFRKNSGTAPEQT
jgi:hypothetical protein